MKMLLRDMRIVELAELLEKHKECSSAPHLVDPKAKRRARQTAKKNGVWKHVGQNLDPTKDILAFKRSDFRQYVRNGNRTIHQAAEAVRSRELELAAMALWLDHPKADLDYLQDLLWAYCDDWTWVICAHEVHSTNDLGSTQRAARLAEILFAFEDLIESEVADRVHAEIERRLFRRVADYDNTEFWHAARMNWNHVCNGGIIRAALLEIKDPKACARLIHPAIQHMTYALDGFTDDGGCVEGPGYWGYGFGHYVQAAYALHCRTGGEVNIMADEKVERICRFPLATHIAGAYRASFADCGAGTVALLNALQINHFHKIPELYELCSRREQNEAQGSSFKDPRHLNKTTLGKLDGPGPLAVGDMHSLALYRGEKATGETDPLDYHLPDLGMVKIHGKNGMVVAALAGNNGVPHNHNDIGTFMVYRHGRMLLTDPGAPQYNYDTFREKRYQILWCRSRGHSVPIINGKEQEFGTQYFGEMSTEGLNGSGIKTATINMSHAYPKGTIDGLVRTFSLDGKTLTIEDAYRFKRKPRSVEEAFVTFEKAVANTDGSSIRIGPKRGGATLTADQAGCFQVETLTEEPRHTKPGTPPLQRITFVPATLSREFTLRFQLV